MPDPRHPRTVRDPRAWVGFGLRHLTALGGAYAIVVLIALAVLAGGLRSLGAVGLVAVPVGLVLGAMIGVIVGTVDGYLVRFVGQDSLRVATTAANGAVTVVVMAAVGAASGASGLAAVLVLVLGPALAVAVVTWRRSPEARRIHG